MAESTTGLLEFLAPRAVPGVEEVVDGTYRRVLTLPHGHGVVAIGAAGKRSPREVAVDGMPGGVRAIACVEDERDRPDARRAARAIVDADADPDAIRAALGDDPLIGASVRANPGLRVPGHPDPQELAIRAVLGQQVSVPAARTLAGRLAAAHGAEIHDPNGSLTRAFPTAAALATMDPADLAMPRSRANALLALATALATGDLVLTPDTDPTEADAALQELPGIGPWTAAYVRMRALGDRDVFLPTDLGVKRALQTLGHRGDPKSAAATAEAWRPYRSYALMHLWGRLAPPSRVPAGAP